MILLLFVYKAYVITPKEKILNLRESGLTYSEIAIQLNIPKSTVAWTIKNPLSLQRCDLFNWSEVQLYYDNQETCAATKTIEYFKMSKGSWQKAIKRGSLIAKPKKIIPMSELLVDDRPATNRVYLKNRLIKEGLIKNVCNDCGLSSSWNGKPLVLQLEHINGKNNDNRFENLCLLCPNCHSQTTTFAGKNCVKRAKNYCVDCGNLINFKSIRCLKCSGVINSKKAVESMKNKTKDKKTLKQKNNTKTKAYAVDKLWLRKVERPTKEELEKLLWEIPTTSIAKKYGVSDKAIGKWAKSYEITKPPRGYWAKQNMRP